MGMGENDNVDGNQAALRQQELRRREQERGPVTNMLQLFTPGDTLTGYCNGYFGRDDYNDKVCISVRPKYALFEYNDGTAEVLNYSDSLTLQMVNEWKREAE